LGKTQAVKINVFKLLLSSDNLRFINTVYLVPNYTFLKPYFLKTIGTLASINQSLVFAAYYRTLHLKTFAPIIKACFGHFNTLFYFRYAD